MSEIKYIDLGLSVKWGDRNIGAHNETDCGYELTFHESEPFAWDNYSNGIRFPKPEEFQELIDKCKWKKDPKGFIIQGPNGNTIFLPDYYVRDGYLGTNPFYWSDFWHNEGDILCLVFDKNNNPSLKDITYRTYQLLRLVNEK